MPSSSERDLAYSSVTSEKPLSVHSRHLKLLSWHRQGGVLPLRRGKSLHPSMLMFEALHRSSYNTLDLQGLPLPLQSGLGSLEQLHTSWDFWYIDPVTLLHPLKECLSQQFLQYYTKDLQYYTWANQKIYIQLLHFTIQIGLPVTSGGGGKLRKRGCHFSLLAIP